MASGFDFMRLMMEIQERTESPAELAKPKRPYVKPELVEFGNVRKYTCAGGTQGIDFGLVPHS